LIGCVLLPSGAEWQRLYFRTLRIDRDRLTLYDRGGLLLKPAIDSLFFVRLFSLLLLCTFAVESQSPEIEPKRTFTHERTVYYPVWNEVPRWEAGLLIGYLGNSSKGPFIYTIDREGRRDDTLFTLDPPAGVRIENYGAAVSPSGEIAVIGTAYTSPLTAFVARIAPDHKHQIVTGVWPYRPMAVTFAPDGTLWTVGYLTDEDNTRVIAYSVLRRFDASGNLLSSVNLRVTSRAGITYLRASRDRVGWFTEKNEYIEFSLDGSELARYEGPPGIYEGSPGNDRYQLTGMALSDVGEVIATRLSVKQRQGVQDKSEILLLDRNARKWIPVALSTGMPEWAQALGFDGTTLVISSHHGEVSFFETK